MVLIGLAMAGGGLSGSDYSEWSLALPGARRGFLEDADGDGMRNGMEYVAGTDPMAVTPVGCMDLVFGMRQDQGERQPELGMVLPAGQPADVLTRLEVSTDLRTWVPLANRFAGGSWIVQQGTLSAYPCQGASLDLRWTGESLGQGAPRLFYRFSAELLESTDADGDGLPDQWERQYGLSPAVNEAHQDPDGDGLSNREEHEAGLHPFQADTDGDGTYDGCQVAAGSSSAPSLLPQPETGLLVLTP